MTAGTETNTKAGPAHLDPRTASRADGTHRRRIGVASRLMVSRLPVSRLLTFAACVVFAGSANASITAPPVLPSNGDAVAATPGVELAGARSQGAERPEPPPRGSSAQVDGGSSADRYGGTSADRGGVAGPHDIRNRGVRQKGFKIGPEPRGNGSRRGAQNEDQERDQDDEEE